MAKQPQSLGWMVLLVCPACLSGQKEQKPAIKTVPFKETGTGGRGKACLAHSLFLVCMKSSYNRLLKHDDGLQDNFGTDDLPNY